MRADRMNHMPPFNADGIARRRAASAFVDPPEAFVELLDEIVRLQGEVRAAHTLRRSPWTGLFECGCGWSRIDTRATEDGHEQHLLTILNAGEVQ